MSHNNYNNFVKSGSQTVQIAYKNTTCISGEEARKLYLEEIKEEPTSSRNLIKHVHLSDTQSRVLSNNENLHISNKDMFLAVQNNDIDLVSRVLDKYPDKIGLIDEFGWSLLMIACQANSTEVAQYLLNRGIDISIRDKAGNSARSLVIKNKNYVLADALLNSNIRKSTEDRIKAKRKKQKQINEEYICESCNKTFPDKETHLSSTIHNISASKGKKIPPHYVIPQTNRGYQLLLKGGWDRDFGLGKDGSGKKYPIKTVQKKDRHGLGHEKKKAEEKLIDNDKYRNKKKIASDYHRQKRLEINFRREFY